MSMQIIMLSAYTFKTISNHIFRMWWKTDGRTSINNKRIYLIPPSPKVDYISIFDANF